MSEKPYEVDVDALANMHTHLREDDDKTEVVGPLVKKAIEGGADVLAPMPNTKDGLKTAKQVIEYNNRVQNFVPPDKKVTILPIILLNEETSIGIIDECIGRGIVDCKVYPLDRTTKSHNGVRHYSRLLSIIKHCGKVGMKCHFHPEHPSMNFDNRDAEFAFLPILDIFLNETDAVIISEHGTDGRCIVHWKDMALSSRFFLTLTAHHLCANEDDVFGDVRAICKPPIKTRADQASLTHLIEEDYDWVMAGLDDAPHDIATKHVHQYRCSCGAYTAPFGLQLYAHAFNHLLRDAKGVEKFVNFTSRNARKLYNFPPVSRAVKLVRKPFSIPLSYQIGSWTVEPFWAGQEIDWQIVN